MTTDVERLAVLIEANTRSYERAMTRLERSTNRAIGRANRSVRSLDRTLKTASASAAAFMANFARGAGLAALTGLPIAVQGAVSAVADLGNAANRAGASAESLQVFRRALEQNGASARDADDGFRRLTRRMGEFANSGAGPAKAAIEGLGLSVFDASGELRSSDEILRQIANRFGQIESPATAAAYAAQLFGDDAGPRLVPLLMQGERALDSFEAQLRDMNALMSNESVQAAIAMDDAYNQMIANISANWRRFVVEEGIPMVSSLVSSVEEGVAALGRLGVAIFGAEEIARQSLVGRMTAMQVRGYRQPSNFFDRSDLNLNTPTAPVEIVDPRQAQALRDLTGQLAAAEVNMDRVSDAFSLFGDVGTGAAQRVGGAVRDEIGGPMDLTTDRMLANLNRLDDQARWTAQSMGDYFGGMFGGLLDKTLEWDDALRNVLARIASNSLSSGISQGFQLLGSGDLFSGVSSLLGFSSGTNWTGSGRGSVKGVVHGEEAVIQAPYARRFQPEIAMMRRGVSPAGMMAASPSGTPEVIVRVQDDGRLAGIAESAGQRGGVHVINEYAREQARQQQRQERLR